MFEFTCLKVLGSRIVRRDQYFRYVSKAIGILFKREGTPLSVTHGRLTTQRFLTSPDRLTYRFRMEASERTFSVAVIYGEATTMCIIENGGAFIKTIDMTEIAIPEDPVQVGDNGQLIFDPVDNAKALANALEEHVCREIF